MQWDPFQLPRVIVWRVGWPWLIDPATNSLHYEHSHSKALLNYKPMQMISSAEERGARGTSTMMVMMIEDVNSRVGDALDGDGYNFDFDDDGKSDDADDNYTPLRMWRGKNRLCSVATHCPLDYDNHLMVIHIILYI